MLLDSPPDAVTIPVWVVTAIFGGVSTIAGAVVTHIVRTHTKNTEQSNARVEAAVAEQGSTLGGIRDTLLRHDITLFGPKGTNGLVGDGKEAYRKLIEHDRRIQAVEQQVAR